MIEREYNIETLRILLTEMLNGNNIHSHFEFYSWFMDFFQLACVNESLFLTDKEYDILYTIDTDIDFIKDVNSLNTAERDRFSFDRKLLSSWLQLIIMNRHPTS